MTSTNDMLERWAFQLGKLDQMCETARIVTLSRAAEAMRQAAGELLENQQQTQQATTDTAAALDLVSRIRFALGDNGARMQDELIEWCKSLSADAERLEWLEKQGYAYGFQDMHEGNRWEFSVPFSTLLRLADAGMEHDAAKEARNVG